MCIFLVVEEEREWNRILLFVYKIWLRNVEFDEGSYSINVIEKEIKLVEK